jgi:hypothetical protein
MASERDERPNPYERQSPWPRLEQGPMRLGPLPKAAPLPMAPAPLAPQSSVRAGSATPMPPAASAELAQTARDPELTGDPEVPAALLRQPTAARRSRTHSRLIPLLAAMAVGLGGLLLLFVLIGS